MGGPWIRAAIGALGVVVTLSGWPTAARGDLDASAASASELGALLGRLEKHARGLEQMERRGSFLLRGRMEELDGHGRVDGKKELVLRVTATPSERITEILSYLEDGADKTKEARDKQKKDASEPEDPKKKFMLPFSPAAKGRYRFTLAERSEKTPDRVRIAFTPLERAHNTYVGSAWVDVPSGEILTMGLSPTKTPLFVDQIEVQVRFENQTTLGRAPSELSFEARGSLLFFKKHYRGSATLTEAKISF
jgi:hypothetical protein